MAAQIISGETCGMLAAMAAVLWEGRAQATRRPRRVGRGREPLRMRGGGGCAAGPAIQSVGLSLWCLPGAGRWGRVVLCVDCRYVSV